jgi:DinB superfamily
MSIFSNRATDPPQERAGYSRAILDLLGKRDPITVLREMLTALPGAIDGMSPAAMRKPEATGKWPIGHVLAHLSDSDLVWGWRTRLILAQDRPTIIGYDQDTWANRLHYADVDPQDAVATFTVLRRSNLRLVERASPDDLRRVGVHEERGEENLELLIRLYAGHELLHLRQIERIRAAAES